MNIKEIKMKNIEKYRGDLVKSILDTYNRDGIQYKVKSKDYNTVVESYLNLLNRLIGPQKRTVHISKEIQTKINGKDAESVRLKGLVLDMQKKMENGIDVNGHLSKTIIRDIHKNDMLLDDWRICHLHLDYRDGDFFDMSRPMSSDLLFAVVLSNNVYFLDITNHGVDDFADLDYLKIMKNNFENELLVKHEDVISINADLNTPNDVKQMRNCGVNFFIHEIDGKYYSVKYALGYSLGKTSMKSFNQRIAIDSIIKKLDIEYDHMIFQPYCIGCICKVYSTDGECFDLTYNYL